MLMASIAFAQPIQSADAGASPLRERIAAIDDEFKALEQSLQSSKASAEKKASLLARRDTLAAEKHKLQAELKDIERRKNSPLVQFHSPAPEAR